MISHRRIRTVVVAAGLTLGLGGVAAVAFGGAVATPAETGSLGSVPWSLAGDERPGTTSVDAADRVPVDRDQVGGGTPDGTSVGTNSTSPEERRPVPDPGDPESDEPPVRYTTSGRQTSVVEQAAPRRIMDGPCADFFTRGAWGSTSFFEQIGMRPFQVDYYGSEVPDTARAAIVATADHLDDHRAVSLDIEDHQNRGWQTEGIGDVSRAAASYGAFARDLSQETATPFGFYGTLPIFDYYDALAEQGPNNPWSRKNDVLAAAIIDHVDFLSPVGYLHSNDLETEMRKLVNVVAEARRVADGKPVLLYVSGEIHGLGRQDPNRFRALSYDEMATYLDTVSPLVDGILLWGWADGGGGRGNSQHFDHPANDGWKQALRDHLAAGGCRRFR